MVKKENLYLFRYVFLFFVLSTSLFLIFKIPIEIFISKYLVNVLFENVPSIWYVDLSIIIISTVYVTISLIKFIKFNSLFPEKLFTIYFIVLLIYLYYRITNSVFQFIEFDFYSDIKYLDVLFLPLFVEICLMIIFSCKQRIKIDKTKNGFFNDLPLSIDTGLDFFKYEPYANNLKNYILKSHFEKSFSIGICGEWGTGKTSFINLIKKEIKDNQVIEIDFAAWKSNSEDAIVIDFFEEIKSSLNKYNPSISLLLHNYSNKLVRLKRNTISQLFEVVISLITGFDSLTKLYSKIGEIIEKIDKKIIIYIDDLDRLDKKEIIQVLKLIRNTANFPNTFFIVAYDRSYVLEAIKHLNPVNNRVFIEKFFQLEITLPSYKSNSLSKKLGENLNEIFASGGLKEEIDLILESLEKHKIFKEWIINIRDVIRLSNSLKLSIYGLKDKYDNLNINLFDFIRIEILRLKFPEVYTAMAFNRFKHIIPQKQIIIRDNITEIESNEDDLNTLRYKELEQILYDAINKNNIEKILSLIDYIFKGDYKDESISKRNSIREPSIRFFYFSYSLLDNDFDSKKFSRLKNQGTKEIKEFIYKIYTNKKEHINHLNFELLQYYENIKTITELKNVISVYFYYLRLIYQDGVTFLNVTEYLDKIYDLLINNDLDKSSVYRIIKTEILNSETPFLLDSDFLHYVKTKEDSDLFPIKEYERIEISINFLKKRCDLVKRFDIKSHIEFQLYRNCIFRPESSQYEKLSEKANSILRRFLIKDVDGFIIEIIKPSIWNEKGRNKYGVYCDIIKALFNSIDDFLSLDEIRSSNYYNEFTVFLDKLRKSKKMEGVVEYVFIEIPVNK